jgi:hypothetical protein
MKKLSVKMSGMKQCDNHESTKLNGTTDCIRQLDSDFPLITNKFAPLLNLQTQVEHLSFHPNNLKPTHRSFHHTKLKSPQSSNTDSLNKRKIILLGASHIRGCLENLRSLLGDLYNVIRITKPNGNISAITSSFNLKTEKLTKQDVVVVCGGKRDVAKNETNLGLRHLSQFAKHTTNTNVIIMCVPRRYDLQSFSCVNNEVASFNRNLQKLMKAYGHILTCSMTNKRDHYTSHGFHMNTLRKNWITNVLAKITKTPLTSSLIRPTIPLPWNSDNSDDKCLVTLDKCPANSMENYLSRGKQDTNTERKVLNQLSLIFKTYGTKLCVHQ